MLGKGCPAAGPLRERPSDGRDVESAGRLHPPPSLGPPNRQREAEGIPGGGTPLGSGSQWGLRSNRPEGWVDT